MDVMELSEVVEVVLLHPAGLGAVDKHRAMQIWWYRTLSAINKVLS
jgi:hypothetical protein